MKKISIFLITFCVLTTASAQDLDKFLEGSVDDANTLMQNYMEPVFVGLGYALNSGWYNTGRPHKMLGVDLTVTVNAAYVPESAQFFTLNNGDLDGVDIEPSETGNTKFPTLMGPNLDADDIPYLVFGQETETTDDDLSVTGPTGAGLDEKFGFNAVPAPALQLGIGLIKNTELKLRLIPEQTFGDPGEEVSTKMFGLGVLHDVKQWIPGIKNLPFDLSGFFAFNTMNTSFQLDADNPDQIAELKTSGTTLQGIISKKLAVLTVYGGVGYISSKTDFHLRGTYDELPGEVDPINFVYSNTGMRANVGARLKLLIFTFHAEYALQKYNTLTLGFGLSVR